MLKSLLAIAAVSLAVSAPAAAAIAEPVAAPQQGYTVIPVAPSERSGRTRQIRCSVGQMRETNCSFTPLFGDGSFQLDGPNIAYRLIIDNGEGYLFEVFSRDERVAIGGLYRRDNRDRACWVAVERTPAPSRICAR
ncbi:MAG: hypothetical protein K2X61_05255 [Caulobacteraceae bacterium]|nr:hypothetical protein [Caulobacteraceae bacterium]